MAHKLKHGDSPARRCARSQLTRVFKGSRGPEGGVFLLPPLNG